MKSRERKLDEILSGYVDILNSQGLDSAQERAFLEKYAKDAEVLTLLRGARAIKGLFESFGQFPDDLKAAEAPGSQKKNAKREYS
jgi:hypothetical protein